MKRLISLLLALTLALTAVPALAANMTLWEQFTKQVQQSAYRATVTFEVTGGGTEALDPSVWLILSSLAPRLTLEGTNSITIATGVGEATASVKLGDQTMARADLRYNKQIMGLSSTLLAGEDIFYTVARDWDLSQLSERLLQGESAWPPTWSRSPMRRRTPRTTP